MISPKDLRVGNWVNEPSSIGKADSFCWIKELGSDVCLVQKRVGEWVTRYQYLEPIILSSELLVDKLGFSKDEDSIFDLVWYSKGGIELTDEFKLSGQNMPPLKYVHQVQNLMYCLTGEELEIKL